MPKDFILSCSSGIQGLRRNWIDEISSQQYHRSSLEALDSIIFSPSHYRVPNQHPLTGKRPCSLGLTVAKQKQNKTGSYCKHVNHGEWGFFSIRKKGKYTTKFFTCLLFGSIPKWTREISPVNLPTLSPALQVRTANYHTWLCAVKEWDSEHWREFFFHTLSFSSWTLVFLFSLSKQKAT